MSATARSFVPPYTPAAPRWWKFVGEQRLVCPAGHHIRRECVIPEWGFIRCSARHGDSRAHAHGQTPECGRWVFLFAVAGGGAVIAEVQLAEIEQMRELRTPAAVLDYLGIFPN